MDKSLFNPIMCDLSLRIVFNSNCLRLSAEEKLPAKIKNRRSEMEWLGILKCVATGKPVLLCLIEYLWLLNLKRNLSLVSPT